MLIGCISLLASAPDVICRDKEAAIVQVSERQDVFQDKEIAADSGKQRCAKKHNGRNEKKLKVKYSAPAVNGKFTVRVTTRLNCQGFNCFKIITICGSFDKICVFR